MKQDRRKFLITSLLGFIGLQLPSSVFAKTITSPIITPFSSKGSLYDTIPQKLRAAAIARKANDYTTANSIYDDIISTDPEEVRAYDGKRKILLKSKYKELEVAQMYQAALALYPNNNLLKKRVATEYIRLSMGNKKFARQLEISMDEHPFFVAQGIFDTVDDDATDTAVQKAKANQLLNIDAIGTDSRNNPGMKALKKQHQLLHKGRFALLTLQQVETMLDDALQQTQNDFRDNNVRELYRVYIEKLKQNQNFYAATQAASRLYRFDKSDYHSLKLARRVARKNEEYALLEEIERSNDSNKQSFWSKLALFDVLLLRHRKEHVGLSNAASILNAMSYKRYSFFPDFEYRLRQVKLAMISGDQTEALTLINNFADRLTGTTSAHFITKFNVLCMRYYLVQNDKPKAMQVISIGLKENDIDAPDPLMKKIIILNRMKDDNKPEQTRTLNYYRDKILNG